MTDPHPQRPDLLAWALAYAAAGTPVFPCAPTRKTPMTANGFHDATTDPDTIHAWWTRTPEANIAAPTGTRTFDVLDVDVRPDGTGWAALNRAKDAGLIDGWSRAITTPSGGLHLHYPGTDQRNATLRGLHLDFRATGGYVLLPPSLGQTKTYSRRYQLIERREDHLRPLDWAAITRLLVPPAGAPRTSRPVPRPVEGVDPTPWLAAHVARQPEGNRNNALFWAACRAAEAGITDYRPLLDAATTVGLDQRQAIRTVESARSTVARTAEHPARSRSPGVVSGPFPTSR